ncbi:hypothetical protein K435DRAFT_53400 [Dendrothele bispora CBS 962.96]|uniref:Uncharacterized protein n=1 Tax=Dendrothele bispora (strain CBS 962.96) TaxID=1314807 RepID=A0A4S8L5N6_DENBC|nr:hypothetical protein K435DRAFT_419577 [Dendrothele bispora CBS 962.96]THU97729.1 hypothetical protein K435DRAFT_53400 [Dendrothele bispora CBS 962.96]
MDVGQAGEDIKDEEAPTDIDLGEDIEGFERALSENPMSDALMDIEEVEAELRQTDDDGQLEHNPVESQSGVLTGRPPTFSSFGAFGTEITNGGVGADGSPAKEKGQDKGKGKGKGKRSREEDILADENQENNEGTPMKKLRRSPRKKAQVASYYPSDEEDLASAPAKRGRKKVA